MPGWAGSRWRGISAPLEQPPRIIFVTAHDRHAVEAFELNALDYLLKPVRAERLAAALRKACVPEAKSWQKRPSEPREYLSVPERHRIALVRCATSFSCAPSRSTSRCARASAST